MILVQFKDTKESIRTEQALINSKIKRNYIQQLLIIEYNQKTIENNLFLTIVKEKKVITYKSYNISIIVTNSKNITKTY